MINYPFYQMLKEPRLADGGRAWTTERLAASVQSTRAHVTQVLNNKPGRGGHTRRKLVRVLRENFGRWEEMLRTLGWSEEGELIGKKVMDD